MSPATAPSAVTMGWPAQPLQGWLWTSRYASPAVVASGLLPVRATLGAPRWGLGFDPVNMAPLLAPPGWLLRADLPAADFRDAYLAALQERGPRRIVQAVQRLRDDHGADPLALCFCRLSPGSFCHRSFLAAWWHEQTGEPTFELGEPEPTLGL